MPLYKVQIRRKGTFGDNTASYYVLAADVSRACKYALIEDKKDSEYSGYEVTRAKLVAGGVVTRPR